MPETEEAENPKSTSDHVKQWQERVSIAKRELDNWAESSGVKRVIEEYNGEFKLFFNGLKGKIPVPPINEIFAFVDADVSYTYNRDPYISVNPESGTVIGAKLWEVILNYYWRKLDLKEEVEPEIVDKNLVGFGWHKTGWEVETEGAEEDLKIKKESLYSARVDWKDVVFNSGSKKPGKDSVWMAQRIVKPVKYVRQKYAAARGRWPLKGSHNPEIDKTAYENSAFKEDMEIAVLWEIWDKDSRQIFLIAEGLNGKWLAEPRPWPEYMESFPFRMYWDTHAPGKPRPMSAVLPWESQVLEKMILLAAAVNHVKRWNRQMLVRKGAITGEDLDKIERGDDGAIISYTGTGDLDKNVDFIEWGSFPPDFMILQDRLSAIQRDVSGQPEFMRGGVTKTQSRTDGELDKIASGAKGRADRRVDRFETHVEGIASDMMKHLKANFDFEETVRITGEAPESLLEILGDRVDPVTRQVKFTPEEIQGDYEAVVKSGSTLPLNRETKSQLLQTLIQTLGNVEETGVSPLLRALISELLDEYDMKSLKLAFKEEQRSNEEADAQAQQEGDANDIKARSQAAKNMAAADKISAEADAVRISEPFVPAPPEDEGFPKGEA